MLQGILILAEKQLGSDGSILLSTVVVVVCTVLLLLLFLFFIVEMSTERKHNSILSRTPTLIEV